MRALYAASGAVRRSTNVSDPRNVQALCIDGDHGAELWLANLTGEDQDVTLTGFSADRMAVLDEETFETCTRDPAFLDDTGQDVPADLVLRPYSVVRLQGRVD